MPLLFWLARKRRECCETGRMANNRADSRFAFLHAGAFPDRKAAFQSCGGRNGAWQSAQGKRNFRHDCAVGRQQRLCSREPVPSPGGRCSIPGAGVCFAAQPCSGTRPSVVISRRYEGRKCFRLQLYQSQRQRRLTCGKPWGVFIFFAKENTVWQR